MRDGILASRAAMVWDSSGGPLSWKAPEDVARDLRIRRSDLRTTECWIEDQSGWRWRKGNMFVTLDPTERKRRFFKHVEFRDRDLVSFEKSTRSSPGGRGRGGRSKNLKAWREFWFYMIEVAKADRLDTDNYANKEKLLNAVHTHSGGMLAKDTTRSEVAAIWRKFIDPA